LIGSIPIAHFEVDMPRISVPFLAAFLAIASCATATTIVPGGNLINQTWTTASHPYIVQGDLTVPPGSTFTIQPGVVVEFFNNDAQAAGLDPSRVEEYYDVQALVDRLSYAGNEAARRYLNGDIDANAAAAWLQKYGLYSLPRAQQRVRFIDQYRSYVINYNLGKDLVQRHIEIESGDPDDEAARWVSFERLISSPRLPSGLRK